VPGAPATSQLLGSQFGNSPLWNPSAITFDPIQTAQTRAQNLLDQNLAQMRAGFGASGLGNSSRSALAQGAAVGQAGAELGDILAGRGLQQRASDQQAFINALLGAGQQNLAERQQGLQGLEFLAGLGRDIGNVGQAEQRLPGLEGIMAFLGLNQLAGSSGFQTAP